MDTSGNLTQTGFIYPMNTDISYAQYTNVLFIDNTVPSYQTFVDSISFHKILHKPFLLGKKLKNRITH